MEQQMIKVSVGDDNRNFKTHKAPVKSLPCTSIPTLSLLQAGCPSCHSTNSVEALKPNPVPQLL